MQEFSSVTASSYDADALAPLLSAKSAEGWDVISIVSAGTNIVAYLSREATGEDTGEIDTPAYLAAVDAPEIDAAEAEVEAEAVMLEEAVIDEAAIEEAAIEEEAAEEIAEIEAAEQEIEAEIESPSDPTPIAAAAVIGDTAADTAVDEPAGWAAVPEETPAAQVSEPEPEPVVPEPVVEEPAAQEPAPVESTVPAGWYADPSGRYELRYWDGSAWTEHVSRAGQQFTDPPVA